MGIKHLDVKAKGDKGFASEWNKDHIIDNNIEFNKYEAQNMCIHTGTEWPSNPSTGQLFYRTDLANCYFFDGENWVAWIDGTRVYEFYDVNDDNEDNIYGVNWRAQTFTNGITGNYEKFNVVAVELKLLRVGDPNNVEIGIYAVDGANKPTGSALATGSLNGYSVTTEAGGDWYRIELSPVELQPGTMYAIVISAPYGDASNYLIWRKDATGPTYTGGTSETSNDSGVSWNIIAGDDFMFKFWGRPTFALGITSFIPIGGIMAWLKSYPNTPALPTNFVECNGQVLNDPDSVYDTQNIPDLNGIIGTQRFLRGAGTSGTTGGSENHSHGKTLTTHNKGLQPSPNTHVSDISIHSTSTLPSYYEVVWIMRIK